MGLTSIHASGDDKLQPSCSQTLSNKEQPMPKHSKYTVADIEKLCTPSIPHVNGSENDEDLPMLDMDDESVELVSNYLSDRRTSHSEETDAALFRSREQIDSSLPMMVPTRLKTAFVVDTNFVISHLSTLEALRLSAPQFHHQIIIPSTVIQELDGLKMSSNKVSVRDEHGGNRQVAHLARCANDWIYRNLANLDSGLMGQKLRQTLDATCIKDDAILDCCLYFKEKLECFVVLMSNDKNLCLKALTEQVLTVSFRKGMSAQLIATKAYEENFAMFGADVAQQQNAWASPQSASQFHELMSMIYNEVNDAVVEAVDHKMRQEYGEEIYLVEYDREKLTTLKEVCWCIVQFWVSVFGQCFQQFKVKKNYWKNLPSYLMEVPTTASEVATFLKFWTEVLNHLFEKRSEQDFKRLDSLNRRWMDFIMQIS